MKTRGTVKKTPTPKKGGAKTPAKHSVDGDVDTIVASPEQVLQPEFLGSPSTGTNLDAEEKTPAEAMVDSRSQLDIEVTGGSSELGTLKIVEVSEKSSDIICRTKIEGSVPDVDVDADVEFAILEKDKVDGDGGKENEAKLEDEAEIDNEAEGTEVDEMEDEVDDEVEDMDEDEIQEGIQGGTDVDDEVEDADVEDEVEEVSAQREIENMAREDEEQTLIELQEDSHPITGKTKLKRLEVFVGGIDKDMTNEQVRNVFEKVGKVLEVRMNRSSQTGKNKGYAFVRFSDPSEAKKAVEEFHNSQISGKICRVTPSLENDILYLGNINKEWNKKNLMDALEKYKIGNLIRVNLLEDAHNEGKNRGYAFLEFTSHKEAMEAFIRLRQRDVVVGGDRTAKVAWSQPYNDPDEETMARVKKVFIDGMPPAWDRERVTEHFGKYGEIERIVLGTDKASTKRKDFGFIEYATRGAAMACIEAVDKTEVGEGDQKVILKVRLSKPILKIKSWRGEIRGNYPIVKDADGGVRSSHSDGRLRKGRKSSGGRHEKAGNSRNHGDASRGDKSDRKKGARLAGGSTSQGRTKFSSPHSGNESASRRRSEFSSSHLERRGPHRETLARESRNYRREGRDYIDTASRRKRGFSEMEDNRRYVEIPLASRSRARLVHPDELPLAVGGSIPYYESPARAPFGRISQYAVGQAIPLPASPLQPYSVYDSLSTAANERTPYPSGGYGYGSMYNGAEIARRSSYASPYGLPSFGASRYSITGANLGPYY